MSLQTPPCFKTDGQRTDRRGTDRGARWEGRGRPRPVLGLPDSVSGGVRLPSPAFGLRLGGLDPLLWRRLLAPGHQVGHVLVEETLHLLSGTHKRRTNGKGSVFIQRFTNQWPLGVLYDTASHSHRDGGVCRATRQPARREQSG